MKQYVGEADTIQLRYTGQNADKKAYDIKCPICNFVSTRLHQHLVGKYKYEEKEAKSQESKIRVMYTWAQKNKHGVAKPLPCEDCGGWVSRLDDHLKIKHKYDKVKTKEIVDLARKKYWCEEVKVSNKYNKDNKINDKEKIKAMKHSEPYTGSTVDYLPPDAAKITDKQKEEWDITGDEFLIYYSRSEKLPEAFQIELVKRKGDSVNAKRYVQHVKFIWRMIDSRTKVLPKPAFSNCLLVEDKYHKYTLSMRRTPGNQTSTLRVRFTALNLFIQFLRRRKVYGGTARADLTKLKEYIDEWNTDFTQPIAQRKTDLRRIKKKRLMTPSHMISYGRSSFVRSLTKKLNGRKKEVFTTRFCQQVRDYIIVNLCIMNGLRSSNIIELRVEDVMEATSAEGNPGYTSMINSKYKTSTIYGEKVIVMPNTLFDQLCIYKDIIRGLLNPASQDYLFVSASAPPPPPNLTHASIGSALTSSFKSAIVLKKI